MDHTRLKVIGATFAYELPVAADHSFVRLRDPKAPQEDAVVSPNRKHLTMTWRTEIRTPGLPRDSRRLGDLRLGCLVGLKSGLGYLAGELASEVPALMHTLASHGA